MTPPSHRHDHDASGPAEELEAKAELREEVWDALEEEGAARFPGAHGRIPNFTGAEDAAERLRGTKVWQGARTVKANPDSPQWPVRQRALEDGKRVYMAVPKQADQKPFLLLDPGALETAGVSPRKASSIKGASTWGRKVAVEEMEAIDLVVTGCVAVARDGSRLGKGGGFSDLEYAVGVEAGLLDPDVPVVTTVHPLQLVDADRIPMTGHDVPLDLVVTPDETVVVDRDHDRSGRIRWELLKEEKIEKIPLLQELREDDGGGA